uniref:Uncharacterized protein n=1 Tax=Lactuca sativa TaxID=4236 RepID=A0A9R1XTD1_LACSA|nr:hypothetical protein LSAT_V11C100027610 [Lactuca sativa]
MVSFRELAASLPLSELGIAEELEAAARVVECLIRLAEDDGGTVEENGPIFLACDTILKSSFKEEIGVHIDDSYFIKLFGVLSSWAEDDVDWSSTMMAASICSLILDSTSETVLECHPHFTRKTSYIMEEFENRITSQVELDFRVVFDQELGLILMLRDMMIGWIHEGF